MQSISTLIDHTQQGVLPAPLRWSIVQSLLHFRAQFDSGLLDNKFKLAFEFQSHTTENLQMSSVRKIEVKTKHLDLVPTNRVSKPQKNKIRKQKQKQTNNLQAQIDEVYRH